MELTQIMSQLGPTSKRGDIRTLAKKIKKDHDLAMELWQTADPNARALSVLIMDKKLLDSATIDYLVNEMAQHDKETQLLLMDWLFANQLTKSKTLISLIESWRESELVLQRRTYWYYQGRLRWMGKIEYDNTEDLLVYIEENIENEAPQVQWAMNFLAGWIGVYQDEYTNRCIKLGEETGLYKGMKVAKNCTPDYLPDFIRIEREKRHL